MKVIISRHIEGGKQRCASFKCGRLRPCDRCDQAYSPLMNHADSPVSRTLQRRTFLKALSASSLAALMAPEPRAFGEEKVVHPKAKADCCILLWMAGGMAAP